MIHEYLSGKRIDIIKKSLGDIADLDLGAGKIPKAKLSLDIDSRFSPNIVADLRFLPFKDGAVRSVVCSHVIEHVVNSDRAMSEIVRILTEGGVAIFFIADEGSSLYHFIAPIWSIYYEAMISKRDSPKSHAHFFTFEKFKEYLSRFFTSVKMGKFNFGVEIFAVCKK